MEKKQQSAQNVYDLETNYSQGYDKIFDIDLIKEIEKVVSKKVKEKNAAKKQS